MSAFECSHCGNARELLPAVCPYCGSADPPFAHTEYAYLNLERGMPLVEDALARLDDFIRAGFNADLKWLVVIHGYGSSGTGGRIRQALRADLDGNRWADRVKEHFPCEAVSSEADLNLSRSGGRDGLYGFLVARRLIANAGATVLQLHARQGQRRMKGDGPRAQ